MKPKAKRKGNKLAVFDLDNTLIDGDTEAIWTEYLFKKKVVDQEFVDTILDYYSQYEQGKLDIYEYQAYFCKPLLTLSPEAAAALRDQFVKKLKHRYRKRLFKHVKRFKTNGFTLLLITATNQFLAEAIAKQIAFENVICTKLKKNGELFINEVEGVPAFGEGKLTLLQNWLVEKNIEFEETWAYSDSHNDLPLLTWSQNPIVVYPDLVLRKYAIENNWHIMD